MKHSASAGDIPKEYWFKNLKKLAVGNRQLANRSNPGNCKSARGRIRPLANCQLQIANCIFSVNLISISINKPVEQKNNLLLTLSILKKLFFISKN